MAEGRRRGGITHIGSLFEKYRARLRPPQGVVVAAFCEAVKAETGIDLPTAKVRYSVSSRTLFLTAPSPQKTEILLAQKVILARLRAELGERDAPKGIH